MIEATLRARYDNEWNGWKADQAVFAGVRRYEQIARLIAQVNPGRILDVGCGDGRLARAIKRHCPGAIVRGCDVSEAALARCEGIDRRYAVDLNRERLPEPDGCFDAVIASEVIEHLVDPDAVVPELARVLRAGGTLLATVPNVAFWRYRLAAVCGHVPSVTADARHLHSFNADLLAGLTRRAGLEVLLMTGLRQRFEWLGRVHYRLLADTLLVMARKP